MIYTLEELLIKMGAPEVREKGKINWHYFDKSQKDLAGHAEVRLEEDGARLIAELQHLRENYEDDEGYLHALYTESFHLHAEHIDTNRYKVMEISFDGVTYDMPDRAIIELGLSIFHARALDISILMVEQTFNKNEMLEPANEDILAGFPVRIDLPVPNKETTGVVVPFPVQRRVQ